MHKNLLANLATKLLTHSVYSLESIVHNEKFYTLPSLNTLLLEQPNHGRHARDVDVDLSVRVLVHVLVLGGEVLPHVARVLVLLPL